VIVWLWDACGPERCGRGVTDDKARAIEAAEACLHTGHANVARVEAAQFVLGITTLATGYLRTGEGLRARSGDTGIRWQPLAGQAAS
jgi:hypothetical protein